MHSLLQQSVTFFPGSPTISFCKVVLSFWTLSLEVEFSQSIFRHYNPAVLSSTEAIQEDLTTVLSMRIQNLTHKPACNTGVRLQSRVKSSGTTVNSQMVFFKYWYCCFYLVRLSAYLFVLFYYFILFWFFFFALFVFWCLFMYLMCFVSLVILVIFSNCCQWEGEVCTQFLLFCLFIVLFFSFFHFSFLRGKVILILLWIA